MKIDDTLGKKTGKFKSLEKNEIHEPEKSVVDELLSKILSYESQKQFSQEDSPSQMIPSQRKSIQDSNDFDITGAKMISRPKFGPHQATQPEEISQMKPL